MLVAPPTGPALSRSAGFSALVPAGNLADGGTGLNPRAFIGHPASLTDIAESAGQLETATVKRVDRLLELRARHDTTDRYLSTLAANPIGSRPSVHGADDAPCRRRAQDPARGSSMMSLAHRRASSSCRAAFATTGSSTPG